jgi:hypothetical protein
MPSVSPKQHNAMEAAAHGNSTLGIPKSVGEDFVMADTKKTGSFHGKSNALGHGGRAAQLKAQGVPGAVIGAIARRKHAAPGQAHYHHG